MKNNKDTKVSVKFIMILSLIIILMSTFAIIYKSQKNIELSDLKSEENTSVEVAKTETKVTSRSMTTSRTSSSNETISEEKSNDVQTEEQVKETAQEVVAENTKYVSVEQVKISKNMDLTVRTGLSREDFIKLIAGVRADSAGFFEQNAGTIYDLCEKYQINEIFFCGLISAESGWNIAGNHRRTHNYISLMSGGKLIQFASVEAGLEAAAKTLHNNYLTPGGKLYHGKTLAGVKTRFCPASSTWVDLVYGRMSQII